MKNNKETMRQAGYRYGGFSPEFGFHMLIDENGKREFWAANKNHASYGIIYKNTHLEFVTSDAGAKGRNIKAVSEVKP